MIFGLNWTISIPAPALALRSWEANILCKRETTRPEIANTTTRTNGIHTFFSPRPTGIDLTRAPSADRQAVSRLSLPRPDAPHHCLASSRHSRQADVGPEARPAQKATARIPRPTSALSSTPSGAPDELASGPRAAFGRAR